MFFAVFFLMMMSQKRVLKMLPCRPYTHCSTLFDCLSTQIAVTHCRHGGCRLETSQAMRPACFTAKDPNSFFSVRLTANPTATPSILKPLSTWTHFDILLAQTPSLLLKVALRHSRSAFWQQRRSRDTCASASVIADCHSCHQLSSGGELGTRSAAGSPPQRQF